MVPLTLSWTIGGHNMPTLNSIIVSPLRGRGHRLLVHDYIFCLAPGTHSIHICWLNELNSPFSMFARLTNAYLIFKYINTQSGYYRTSWPRGHFILKLTLPVSALYMKPELSRGTSYSPYFKIHYGCISELPLSSSNTHFDLF